MIVGTSEAAKILNISTPSLGAHSLASFADAGSHRRLRVLLIEGRVESAYKTGKIWLIPLFNGKPIIEKGKRGPAPRWRNPRKPAKTLIHVNTHKIKENHKKNQKEPVIIVKKGNTNQYGHEVEIPGGCRVIYRPNKKICGGARVWIESLYEVQVIERMKDDHEG